MKFLLIKYMCAFLCVFLLLGTFAACNGSETESDSIEESESFAETDALVSEKETTSVDNDSQTADTEDNKEMFNDILSLKIESGDGFATVTAPDGLTYSVSGYDAITEYGFSYSDALVFDLGESFANAFNRFSLSYISDSPAKISVKYSKNEKIVDDSFFLEAGENIFSGLVLHFLKGDVGAELSEIRVESCEDKNASFAILGLSTEKIAVPEDTYYLDGERYKLGIDIAWGGTVSYLFDKQCPVEGLTNLINKHDRGRLVQQSYYGTGAIEGVFEWGKFNSSDKWPYNPVQGGDQGAISSRLIDFVIEEDCVYIKAQPMDWGKIGYITPSYMENWYTVADNYVRVDNRFVDFSGWEHPYKGQEIPAFYTVSYLDSFVWYDGVAPWTGDELSYRHDLKFWGDSQYSDQCSFKLKTPNTETWSAWVNMKDDYGIGLYTPNADRYTAGRHQYNGSKFASNNATNYTAPWKQIKLVSFLPLEYSYLMTTGSVEEIRAVFTENKDFIANECLSINSVSNRRPYFDESLEVIDLSREDSVEYLLYPNGTEISYDAEEAAVKLTSVTHDPYVSIDYLTSPVELYAKDYNYVEIEYMIPDTNGQRSYRADLFVCAGTRINANAKDRVSFALINDGKYHTARISLLDVDCWTGRVNAFRLDYFDSQIDGDVMFIRSFRLTKGETVTGLEAIDFNTENSIEKIASAVRTKMTFDADVNMIKLEVTGNDPSITLDYSASAYDLLAEEYKTLRITYMIPAGQSRDAFPYVLYPCAGEIKNPSPNALIHKNASLSANGELCVLELDLSQHSFWTGKINKIRFDYFNACAVGDVFYIASVELVK